MAAAQSVHPYHGTLRGSTSKFRAKSAASSSSLRPHTPDSTSSSTPWRRDRLQPARKPSADREVAAASTCNPSAPLPPSSSRPQAASHPLLWHSTPATSPSALSLLFSTRLLRRRLPFRKVLVPEVALITIGLAIAIHKLANVVPPPGRSLPIPQLASLTAVLPLLALFRRPPNQSYFHVPFTDDRGYRDWTSADDGFAAAIGLPLLLASGFLYEVAGGSRAHERTSSESPGWGGVTGLVQLWEFNHIGSGNTSSTQVNPAVEAAKVLYNARVDLFCLIILNVFGLLVDICLDRAALRLRWLTYNNTKRFFGCVAKSALVSTFIGLLIATGLAGPGVSELSPYEGGMSVFLGHLSVYIVSRLARRGFTLGELSTFSSAGVALMLETGRLLKTRWQFARLGSETPSIFLIPPTFRSPTPILAFQHVLIPGIFTIGFILAPLLVSSRALAQQPTKRFRTRQASYPQTNHGIEKPFSITPSPSLGQSHDGHVFSHLKSTSSPPPPVAAPVPSSAMLALREKERNHRFIALAVYTGTLLIVVVCLGGWAGWNLGGSFSTPWSWAIRFVLFGGNGVDGMTSDNAQFSRWLRIGLVMYWLSCISSAVGGWTTHFVRKRRNLIKMTSSSNGSGSNSGIGIGTASTIGSMVGIQHHRDLMGKNGSSGLQGSGGNTLGAEEMRDEKRLRTRLNFRRKFFHALALVMFIPGIILDPGFTSLAFSGAFAMFTLAEYARYFALFPIGAAIHVFFSEFIDSKDSGPVILSHFYLLTGCAGGVWLEVKGINRLTGVLVLGVGDSMASIVGKRMGRLKWLRSAKTVEGTVAFALSMFLVGLFLRSVGVVESFSAFRYLIAVTMSALLEASTQQNDNLVIPLYAYSILSLLDF